jgi:hypothetical protein
MLTDTPTLTQAYTLEVAGTSHAMTSSMVTLSDGSVVAAAQKLALLIDINTGQQFLCLNIR